MPAFRELQEVLCSYLKVRGWLFILGAPTYGCLFSVEVCHAIVFSRVGGIDPTFCSSPAPESNDIGNVMIKKSAT